MWHLSGPTIALEVAPTNASIDRFVVAGDEISSLITYRNTANHPILVRDVKTSCGCIGLSNAVFPMELAAGQKVKSALRLGTSGRNGFHEFTIVFRVEDQDRHYVVPASVSVDIAFPVTAFPASILFDVGDPKTAKAMEAKRTIVLAHQLPGDMLPRIRGATANAPGVSVTLNAAGTDALFGVDNLKQLSSLEVIADLSVLPLGVYHVTVDMEGTKPLKIPLRVINSPSIWVAPEELTVVAKAGESVAKVIEVFWNDEHPPAVSASIVGDGTVSIEKVTPHRRMSERFETALVVPSTHADYEVVFFVGDKKEVVVPLHVRPN